MAERMKQLDYELGGEKAKVAELEDKIEGMTEAQPLLERTQAEVASLQKEVSKLQGDVKSRDREIERKEKEAGGFKDRLRKLKEKATSDAEAAQAQIEMLHDGEGLDYARVTRSPAFTPVFEVLTGMVVNSVREKISALYPDFDFGLLDEALKPKPAPVVEEKDAGEKDQEKSPPSQEEGEPQNTPPLPEGEKAEKERTPSPVKDFLNALEQAASDGDIPPPP